MREKKMHPRRKRGDILCGEARGYGGAKGEGGRQKQVCDEADEAITSLYLSLSQSRALS